MPRSGWGGVGGCLLVVALVACGDRSSLPSVEEAASEPPPSSMETASPRSEAAEPEVVERPGEPIDGEPARPEPQFTSDLSTVWLARTDRPVLDAAAASAGKLVVLESESYLSSYGPTGNRLWQRRPDDPTYQLRAPLSVAQPGDAIIVPASWAFDGERPPPNVLLQFAADGTNAKQLDVCSDESGYNDWIPGPGGDRLLLRHDGLSNRLWFNAPDGTERWMLLSETFGMHAYNFDPQGNIVIAGVVTDAFTLDGKTFGKKGPELPDTGQRSLLVVKVTPALKLLWSLEVPGVMAPPSALEISAKGTVVLAGSVWQGSAAVAGTQLTPPPGGRAGYLIAIESHGAPRWAKQLASHVLLPWPFKGIPAIALDPAGKVSVAQNLTSPCNSVLITDFNLAGEKLGDRELRPHECNGGVRATALVRTAPDLVLAGEWKGSLDFGRGIIQSTDPSGYLLKLGKTEVARR
jgi:hypothetical protein